ncbi:MAG TPA: M20/M25/M40 family metallo-hydrolase [Woeseiaceae bacterium]|nr:M20/M25/M40 family metallo-hydrolase [Woeseiaceae bacterium]
MRMRTGTDACGITAGAHVARDSPRRSCPWGVAACLATLLALPLLAAAQGLDDTESRMVEWIDARLEDAVALLEETVDIQSGTLNLEGVTAVGAVMRRELDALGFATEWIELPPAMQRAGHLVGRRDGDRGPKFLLIGHLDTVFEDGAPFARTGNVATGAGVVDMKGGNVVIVHALRALREAGVLDGLSLAVIYTGDEEKPGEPLAVTRAPLVELGKWADVALGFEGAAHEDGVDYATVARRSSSDWRLEVSGRQAHSSRVFSEEVGAGAIFEAARILAGFYDEVRGEEYLTFNAGAIVGGTDVEYDYEQNRGSAYGKTNVVPRKVVVHGGIRTISQEQLERAREAMRRVVARHLPHTDATIVFEDGYPPMAPTEGNRRLAAALSGINEALGRGPMPLLDPSKRGAADISFVAPYTDALAGLGPAGEGSHSPHERLEVDSLALAAKRTAILLYRLSRQERAPIS